MQFYHAGMHISVPTAGVTIQRADAAVVAREVQPHTGVHLAGVSKGKEYNRSNSDKLNIGHALSYTVPNLSC